MLSDVRITRKGVTDEDRVVPLSVEGAIGLKTNMHLGQRAIMLQWQRLREHHVLRVAQRTGGANGVGTLKIRCHAT